MFNNALSDEETIVVDLEEHEHNDINVATDGSNSDAVSSISCNGKSEHIAMFDINCVLNNAHNRN